MLMSGNLTVWIFQSTLSVRRATGDRLMSCDPLHDFNPRSP